MNNKYSSLFTSQCQHLYTHKLVEIIFIIVVNYQNISVLKIEAHSSIKIVSTFFVADVAPRVTDYTTLLDHIIEIVILG